MALWPNTRRDIFGSFPAISSHQTYQQTSQRRERQLAYFGNSNIVAYSSVPEGMFGSRACILAPIESGGMAMDGTGTGDLTADLIPSYPMTIDLTGSSDFDATAALVVSMAAAFTGSGTLTATISGIYDMSIDLTGSGSMTAAMTALGNMLADLTGAGDLDATIAGIGDMTIDIVVTGTGLTTANVGQAVWAALAATNNDPGTMGEKLNDAGSASNPWTEVLESGFTAAEILRLIAAAVAGASSGGPGSPVFKGLDGTTDRISGTADSDGNRSGITYDGS